LPVSVLLVQAASNLREHIVGIRTDEANRPNNQNENDSQHYCVFCNVLTLVIRPERANKHPHQTTSLRTRQALLVGEGRFRDDIMPSAGHLSRQLIITEWHVLATHWHFPVIQFASRRCNAKFMAKKKNPAAVELGRKGGKRSAENLTEEQRKEKARKAALARWTKRKK